MANQALAPNPLEQFKLRLSIWKDAIPRYEGGTRLLSHFIQTCDRFVSNLATNDEVVNESLFALIKSRIQGEALDLIVVNKPTTWIQCKTLLINRFSDPCSEELLFNRLSTCFQQINQTYEKYADEIKSRLNKLKEHIQINNDDDNIISLKNTFYENIAKNVFINGVKDPYHSYLMHFELGNLEDCLMKCRKYDSNEQQATFLNFMRQRENKPKNAFNVTGATKNTFTPQPRQNIMPMPFIPFVSNFGNKPANNNYQNQTFGNKPNQPFGNRPNTGNQNQRPTPMSISTRNTNRPNNNFAKPTNFSPMNMKQPNFQPNFNYVPGNQFFKSTGPPNFISEELHCQEDQQNMQEIDYQEQEEQYENLQHEISENQETIERENFPQDSLPSEEI